MVNENPIPYYLIRSERKSIGIQITADGVVVRAPKWLSAAEIDRFVQSRRSWIDAHLSKIPAPQPKFTREEIEALVQNALTVIPDRVRHFAPMVGVSYGRITIRNQRSRWGSCSGKGNLNFNCLLMLTPSHVIDYVVVHELCHRKEMNHSQKFWALVEGILPDYLSRRKWLKENGAALLARMPK
jgi:predicted metal-dependent hydrolase